MTQFYRFPVIIRRSIEDLQASIGKQDLLETLETLKANELILDFDVSATEVKITTNPEHRMDVFLHFADETADDKPAPYAGMSKKPPSTY